MRLLNTNTLDFREFFDTKIPDYAILSHRWEEDEVSYADFVEKRNQDGAGYRKIVKFCKKARKNSYE